MENINIWDAGKWAKCKEIKFDFMTRYIFEHILQCLDVEGKRILELGAGTGRLSYLLLQQGAEHVTMVDSSRKAIEISSSLFKDTDTAKYKIIASDILKFNQGVYDLVFSSGVIEHFKGNDRFEIVKKHLTLANHDCILIHPTDTLYAMLFNNFPMAIKLYGYQKCFSEQELMEHISRTGDYKNIKTQCFHFFYTVPFFHNIQWINRLTDNLSLPFMKSGLTLTHIETQHNNSRKM